ncbi:MAG: DNA adenine methylase [Nitrospinae bacterium]|nr:DNA adenine methylase [Nitrospinota bacterium]
MLKSNKQQMVLIEDDPTFPSTRFQGSKLKIVDWIYNAIKGLDFNTALDAFGGTACVGYMLKEKGKKVTCNDILKFNWLIASALTENDKVKLTDNEVDLLLTRHSEIKYPTFVCDTFKNIYFADEENQWIDMVVTNISLLDDIYKKALAYFALFRFLKITKNDIGL